MADIFCQPLLKFNITEIVVVMLEVLPTLNGGMPLECRIPYLKRGNQRANVILQTRVYGQNNPPCHFMVYRGVGSIDIERRGYKKHLERETLL